MTKRIVVTGKNGQLGRSIRVVTQEYPQFEFVFVGRDELDLSSSQCIVDYFSDKTFDVIVNCAAYTAVDQAESDAELTDQVNHFAVQQLAQVAKEQGILLIHISTDYVFNGRHYKPYVESDATDPQGVYGLTKLKGEQAIQDINPNSAIIRTSWVYSEFGNNFVKTMLRLGKERDSLNVIFDQVGSPTYAGDLADAILKMAEVKLSSENRMSKGCEIYHYSNEGVCSWYDFAKAVFELSHIQCEVGPIETKDYPTPATRPHYSLMNKAKIKQAFNLMIPYWKDSLQTCLQRLER